MNYQDTWTGQYTLAEFNLKSHDGVERQEELRMRAQGYCEAMFPEGFFGSEDVVLDFGCGVGYIAEELLNRFAVKKLVGLDISRPTLELAQRRFSHPALSWRHYDGRGIPFEDSVFDKVYSTACIQHVEEHAAFLLLSEIMRILKPEGTAVLHFATWKKASHAGFPDYREECRMILNNEECHWHVLYTREELEVKFIHLLGASAVQFKNIDPDGCDVITYVTKYSCSSVDTGSFESEREFSEATPWWRLPLRALSILWYEGGAALVKEIKSYLTWFGRR